MSILKVLGKALDEIADIADQALSNKSELELRLDEALSKKQQGVALSRLREIAQETYNSCVRARLRRDWGGWRNAGACVRCCVAGGADHPVVMR